MRKLLVWILLSSVFVLLAWKNPGKDNNLIGNLEPYPDTLYYSVPAWNWVRGDGFEMKVASKKINSIVPAGYGLWLVPGFGITNDVRSYYWVNMLLGLISLGVFVFLGFELYTSLVVLATGLIWVTNFYNYNLPSLLMAENLLIPLTLGTVLVLVKKLSLNNICWSIAVGVILVLTKMSALPVLGVLGLGMLIKISRSNDNYLKKIGILSWLTFAVLTGLFLKMYLPIWSTGNSDMSWRNFSKNVLVYFYQLQGNGSTYLWYANPLMEKWVGLLGMFGLAVGVLVKKRRKEFLSIGGVLVAVLVFHAMKFYPEGRYISTLIPLLVLSVGMVVDRLGKFKFLIVLIMLLAYFGQRVTLNGFRERKITTLKRQMLNNFRAENEVPWNYKAVQFFNGYFLKSDKKSYLATLLPAFYVDYFSNQNYEVLPVSETQEFSSKGKDLVGQYYKNDGSIVKMYQRLMREGAKVYISNYYLQNHRADWDADFKNIENSFAFEQVAAGCMDLCKIYKIENKPTPYPSLQKGGVKKFF